MTDARFSRCVLSSRTRPEFAPRDPTPGAANVLQRQPASCRAATKVGAGLVEGDDDAVLRPLGVEGEDAGGPPLEVRVGARLPGARPEEGKVRGGEDAGEVSGRDRDSLPLEVARERGQAPADGIVRSVTKSGGH